MLDFDNVTGQKTRHVLYNENGKGGGTTDIIRNHNGMNVWVRSVCNREGWICAAAGQICRPIGLAEFYCACRATLPGGDAEVRAARNAVADCRFDECARGCLWRHEFFQLTTVKLRLYTPSFTIPKVPRRNWCYNECKGEDACRGWDYDMSTQDCHLFDVDIPPSGRRVGTGGTGVKHDVLPCAAPRDQPPMCTSPEQRCFDRDHAAYQDWQCQCSLPGKEALVVALAAVDVQWYSSRHPGTGTAPPSAAPPASNSPGASDTDSTSRFDVSDTYPSSCMNTFSRAPSALTVAVTNPACALAVATNPCAAASAPTLHRTTTYASSAPSAGSASSGPSTTTRTARPRTPGANSGFVASNSNPYPSLLITSERRFPSAVADGSTTAGTGVAPGGDGGPAVLPGGSDVTRA
eukprot:TRINITY_DN8280_c0_g1_i1.p1 TRINITY_DN8280_c0_g1~~TRINITY_DN8280_c0_g1_i1.p1  ORF type:complete len:407 (+),score=79.37 TRINITY_DN8280_c0_g1_i1:490-1710(+)